MEKGEHLKALEIARELLSLNFSVEQVMTITKLSPADIATLEK